MIVAGGCYRELCECPHWDSVLGSGGRAALVLAGLEPDVRLMTYRPDARRPDLYPIEVRGVAITAQLSATEVAFSYLHPLSSPVISPKVFPQENSMIACDKSVLRFGFMEGDAIVKAECAVYDPQSSNAQLFTANGSSATKLALVLNESELRHLGKSSDITTAANNLLELERADTVVVKCGVMGAWVFVPAVSPKWVSAYRSSSVFKIGTGDVFTATFAHHWATKGQPPFEAASLASQSVAIYAASRTLPLSRSENEVLIPVAAADSRVVVVSATSTLADHWLREEAISRLHELGAEVHAAAPDNLPAVGNL